MKNFRVLMVATALMALCHGAIAQDASKEKVVPAPSVPSAPASNVESTTVTTTTTAVPSTPTAPATQTTTQTTIAPAVAPVPAPVPTGRDAITGEPVPLGNFDQRKKEEPTLRDQVRSKLKD